MIRRIALSLIVFVIGVTMIWGQETPPETDTITAEGLGVVALNGNVDVRIKGQGMLFIVDRTDNTEIEVSSEHRLFHLERQARGNTVHIYRQFQGSATIRGDDIAVVMEGLDIHVAVSGTGMMLLKGDGDYTSNGLTRPWAEDGMIVAIGDGDR